jgi:hypothetical protein
MVRHSGEFTLAGAYYSHVIVKVSSDRVTWTPLNSSTWHPSATGIAKWEPQGSVSSIRYVNITAWDDPVFAQSANFYVGAVAIK